MSRRRCWTTCARRKTAAANWRSAWNQLFADYRQQNEELGRLFEASLHGDLPDDWAADIPEFSADKGPMATRDAGSKVLNAIARKVPWLMGGSGDLAPSTKTLIEDSGYFEAGQYENRNIAWGVREHAMCGVLFRPGVARRDSPLCGDVLHLHRLRPARDSSGRDDGTARHLYHDA